MTWTVFVAKSFELRSERREARAGLRILASAATFAQAHDQLRNGTSPVAKLMQEAAQEIRLSAPARGDGLKERIVLQLERVEVATSRKISRGTASDSFTVPLARSTLVMQRCCASNKTAGSRRRPADIQVLLFRFRGFSSVKDPGNDPR